MQPSDDQVTPQDSLLGSVLDGRYRIEKMIGRGGMGTVYAATQLNLERAVAVKMLRKEYSKNKQFCARFMREAMALSRVSHPAVLHAYDHGLTEDGRLYLVTELLKGQPLHRWIAAQPGARVGTSEAIRILRQLAGALEAVHGFLVHRDLKPQNIIVEHLPEGVAVKLLDFGVIRPSRGSDLTQGGMIGTPLYMSPEQIQQDEALDARADLYSLGVMGFELIAGRVPFSGEARVEVLEAHLVEPLPDLAALAGDDVPTALIALVCELLEKSAEDRPQTAAEVRLRLEQIERDREESLTPILPAPILTTPPKASRSQPPSKSGPAPEEAPFWMRRGPLMTAGLLLILGTIATVATLRHSRPPPEGVIERIDGPFPFEDPTHEPAAATRLNQPAEKPTASAAAGTERKVADTKPPSRPAGSKDAGRPAAKRPSRPSSAKNPPQSRRHARRVAPRPRPAPKPAAPPSPALQTPPVKAPAPKPPETAQVRFRGVGTDGSIISVELLHQGRVVSGLTGLRLPVGRRHLTIRRVGGETTRTVEVDVRPGGGLLTVMAP